MTDRTIVMQGVSRRFGKLWAVRGVDLALQPGECVGLVGHNGAGKSTLIKMMLGLLRPTEGTVRVLGEDPADGKAAVRQALGYLPENLAFQPGMTGAETLAFYARLKRQAVRRNADLLDRVGLGAAARRRVGTYSKGMRQRLGLAQALLGAPRVLLLDEPTTGLDPALRQSFYAILHELRDEGAAILLSTHALAELEGEVDRVIVMNSGHKLADGAIQVLRGLSGIRPRLRIRLAQPFVDPVRWQRWRTLPGGLLETSCHGADILPLLRALPDEATDVEVVRPSLDEVYATFLQTHPTCGEAPL
ncbi:MAG: ABC transporter ATP-binding protein [Acetobacteraceae bacterium]